MRLHERSSSGRRAPRSSTCASSWAKRTATEARPRTSQGRHDPPVVVPFRAPVAAGEGRGRRPHDHADVGGDAPEVDGEGSVPARQGPLDELVVLEPEARAGHGVWSSRSSQLGAVVEGGDVVDQVGAVAAAFLRQRRLNEYRDRRGGRGRNRVACSSPPSSRSSSTRSSGTTSSSDKIGTPVTRARSCSSNPLEWSRWLADCTISSARSGVNSDSTPTACRIWSISARSRTRSSSYCTWTSCRSIVCSHSSQWYGLMRSSSPPLPASSTSRRQVVPRGRRETCQALGPDDDRKLPACLSPRELLARADARPGQRDD